MMDISSWMQVPERIEYKPAKDYGVCRALYYDTIPYRGDAKTAFAYLAMPADGKPVPGVVLLHGGGGTAYPQWAEAWAQRGYAALALDMEGGEPAMPGGYEIERNPHGGPRRTGDFDDSTLPVKEQWMYHGLAAASRGYSLLRSLPGVLPDSIGLCGISWGGIAASILITLDPRFSFCVPIYGCGFLPGDKAFFGSVFAPNERARALWDPSDRFPQVKTPVLWVNGLADFAFSLEATIRSQDALPGSRMALLPGFTHGHEQGWGVQEAYAFADAVVRGREPFPTVSIRRQGDAVAVQLGGLNPSRAYRCELHVSREGVCYTEAGECATQWEPVLSMPVVQDSFTLPLPREAALAFVNCVDDRGLVATSNALMCLQIGQF